MKSLDAGTSPKLSTTKARLKCRCWRRDTLRYRHNVERYGDNQQRDGVTTPRRTTTERRLGMRASLKIQSIQRTKVRLYVSYLTGNPSITFWKVVYRRYTSFALESIEQVFSGSVNYGKKVSCTVSQSNRLIKVRSPKECASGSTELQHIR